jgi:IMP dehydrogenase
VRLHEVNMNKYLDDFMKTFPYEGLTYDDVTLVTQYADFLPDDASLETKLTSRTTMKIPFISAPRRRWQLRWRLRAA